MKLVIRDWLNELNGMALAASRLTNHLVNQLLI